MKYISLKMIYDKLKYNNVLQNVKYLFLIELLYNLWWEMKNIGFIREYFYKIEGIKRSYFFKVELYFKKYYVYLCIKKGIIRSRKIILYNVYDNFLQ